MTEEEGDIHCHGLAWSSDPNDISAIFKFNNFFYVSLYDHWYTRGYVENSLDGDFAETGVPMCACVEEMPMVSRADCTQVTSVEISFTIDWAEDEGLTIESGPLTAIQLNECQGHEFGNRNRNENNDLASHVNVLVANERISVDTQVKIFETLVGYGEPNNNDNEEACALAVARQRAFALERETAQARAETAQTAPSKSRGPVPQIVASVVLCLVIVGAVILTAKSERVRNLLLGQETHGHQELGSSGDDASL